MRWLLVACCIASALLRCDGLAVMSIDLGSEWIKVGVVSPGVPLDMALNGESKRKTPAAISLRDGVRQYGDDAITTGVRFPPLCYRYLLPLLGKSLLHPSVQLFQRRFPHYKLQADPIRDTVIFQHQAEKSYSVEELLSMMLTDARSVASAHTGQTVTDAVITVPAYFGQAERRSVMLAAELAGIKTLQLINDNAAVALNYGMFRRKDFNSSAQYIVFYDMGAGSTAATLVSYQLVKTKERGITETNPQLQVLGYSYDRDLGGLEMSLRLRDHLAAAFTQTKKTSADVYTDHRAMAKLLKEAERVKKIISANAETYAQVEGLLDEEDFRHQVTRQTLEELCADLYPRVWTLVEEAVRSAGMELKHVDQLMLVGGGTRVPRVQELLQEKWGSELSKSINADEAAAMGAVYRAADLSTGFRVMKFHVRDHVHLPIVVDFEREVEEDDGQKSTRVVRRNLFTLGNPYPQKKVITFSRNTDDFGFTVNHGDLTHLTQQQISEVGRQNLSYVLLSGVAEAFSAHSGEDVEGKGVKVHFQMDDSGLLNLTAVEVVFEKTGAAAEDDESTLSKLSSAFSSMFNSDEKPDAEGDATEQRPDVDTDKSDNETAGQQTTDGNNNTANNNTKQLDDKPKIKTVKVPVSFTQNNLNIPAMTADAVTEIKNKIADMDETDRQRARQERSRNALESFINEAQSRMYEQEYEQASTAEQREQIQSTASQMSDWLYEDGFDETAAVFEDKLEELKKLTRALYARVEEHSNREEAVKALTDVFNMTEHFLASAEKGVLEGVLVEADVTPLNKMFTTTKEWLKKKLEEQSKTPLTDTPKLKLSAMGDKYTALDREIKYLVNKIKVGTAKKMKEDADRKLQEQLDKIKAKDAENATYTIDDFPTGGTATADVEDSTTTTTESTDDPSAPDGEHTEL